MSDDGSEVEGMEEHARNSAGDGGISRRALLRGVGPVGVLGALIGFTAHAGWRAVRHGRIFRAGGPAPVCAGCQELNRCALPEAESARRALFEAERKRTSGKATTRIDCPYGGRSNG